MAWCAMVWISIIQYGTELNSLVWSSIAITLNLALSELHLQCNVLQLHIWWSVVKHISAQAVKSSSTKYLGQCRLRPQKRRHKFVYPMKMCIFSFPPSSPSLPLVALPPAGLQGLPSPASAAAASHSSPSAQFWGIWGGNMRRKGKEKVRRIKCWKKKQRSTFFKIKIWQ